MELLVVRHGQSEADILGRHEGRADYELTALGMRQAKRLAEWVNEKFPPDYILSSPLKRAVQTASIISEKCGIDVTLQADLMEFNNGLLAGLTFEEAREKYPAPAGGKKPHVSYYQQETMIEFRMRAEAFLSKIIHEYPENKRLLIVSHGGMMNMLFRSFMMLPIGTDFGIYNGDTAAHLWRVEGSKRYIDFMNSQEHLR